MSRKPLAGLRIVVTRPKAQSESFTGGLEALGAKVIHFPTIAIVPPADTSPLDRALAGLETYDWVIFTSVNGVDFFWQRGQAIGANLEALRERKVGAIGPATADALRVKGVQPDLLPDKFVAEALLEALQAVAGLRFLLPRADIARAVLPEELTARGALVDDVAVYRTVTGQPDASAFGELAAGVDVVTFTSPSTVRNFIKLAGDALDSVTENATIACIGPVTERAAREAGLPAHIVATDYTTEGLLDALAQQTGQPRTI